jgi:hypothetical protein
MSEISKNAETTSFESLFFKQIDEQEEKQEQFIIDSQAKQMQLLKQVGDARLKIVELERQYKKSLIDPKVDSVRLRCQILAAREELTIAEEINNLLFPKP